MTRDYERHAEAEDVVPAPPELVFAYLDEPARLSSHMTERTWMMGGGRMEVATDEGRGRRVGSHVRLSGRFFGLRLHVEAVVTEHEVPRHKAWETVGEPRLLVIGAYCMRVTLAPMSNVGPHAMATRVRIGIDYDLPRNRVGQLLGRLVGPRYARWCTRRMAIDAATHFASSPASPRVSARAVPS